MKDTEIKQNIEIYAAENNLQIKDLAPIPKSELISGNVYRGICRNASVANWTGLYFVYKRNKFGYVYEEKINHYEDDDGYDVFVPIKVC